MKRFLTACWLLCSLTAIVPWTFVAQGAPPCGKVRLVVNCTTGDGCNGFFTCTQGGTKYIYGHSIDSSRVLSVLSPANRVSLAA